MWDLIVSAPDHWLSFYYAVSVGTIYGTPGMNLSNCLSKTAL